MPSQNTQKHTRLQTQAVAVKTRSMRGRFTGKELTQWTPNPTVNWAGGQVDFSLGLN
jgi:hypothetical protein